MRAQLERLIATLEQYISPVAIVIAGVGLTFVTGLVPHRAHAYVLLPMQVAAGVLPYVLYGMLAWMLREPEVRRYGLGLLGVHLLAVLLQRLLTSNEGGALLVVVPLVLAALLLTLWPRALRASAPRSKPPEDL